MIIAIDGPAGSGKSTIARKVAQETGFAFIESGAMYRAVTYKVLKENIDLDDPTALANLLDNFAFKIDIINSHNHYFVDNKDVTEALRSVEVTALVSKVAKRPEIRQTLVKIQRQCSEGVNSVFEGRDMGTVVFPNAMIKIFLTASPEERAERRYKEMIAKDPSLKDSLDKKQLLETIVERDHVDSTREHSPLKQAEDAHLIDTTNFSIEEVVDEILKIVHELKK